MSRLFLHIYDQMGKHKVLLYVSLVFIFCISVWGTCRLSFNEDITGFFSGESKGGNSLVPSGLMMADRIIVSVSGGSEEEMKAAADLFMEEIEPLVTSGLLSYAVSKDRSSLVEKGAEFIYDYLPIYLDEGDYPRIDSLLTYGNMQASLKAGRALMMSPLGGVVGDVIHKDPLNIGTPLLRMYMRFNSLGSFHESSGYIFTQDKSSLLILLEPFHGMGNTGANSRLVSDLEAAAAKAESTGVDVGLLGGPYLAVCNARQIKRDTSVTIGIALLLIALVIVFSFRNRWSLFLILLPPIFGAVFSLGCIGFVKDQISAIAIGVGAVVMGVSLSYSIHVVSHANTQPDPRKIISELASPLTIGCLTTVGAFVALIFTRSSLLRDMGLFASLALVGTTLFSLVYLPHMIGNRQDQGQSRLLRWIEGVNSYPYHDNKIILAFIALVVLVCLFFYGDVKFESDLSSMNYMPEEALRSEQNLQGFLEGEGRQVYMVTSAESLETAYEAYANVCGLCAEMTGDGLIDEWISVEDFIIPYHEQVRRIGLWNDFWAKRSASALSLFDRAALSIGYETDSLSGLREMVTREYEVCSYQAEEINQVPMLSEWISSADGKVSLVSMISLDKESRPQVYSALESVGVTSIMDAGYISSKMADDTVADFNYLLWVCSLLVFFALLFSYGRIELALITFLPMCVSWIIILGCMAIFDIRFNVVNIILTAFIFGLGDDFSIFIMDGLMHEHKTGRKALNVHKTAIFFSAFTAIASLGAMMFAKHPALKSIGLISVLGLCVVVLVSYTVQPFLFRMLVLRPTSRKGFPHTILSLLNTIYVYSFFFIGCVIARLYIGILFFIPIKRMKKRRSLHMLVHKITRIYVKAMFTVRKVKENPYGENFDKPAVVIANHQSFIDIILILSLSPKLLVVANDWVWNSPFFGKIIRYAGFFHTSEGYENMVEQIRERVSEGYSVVIFPEGTRSPDCSIQRFHKGAFYLAQTLCLDIVPVIIYGAGQVSSKRQGFYIKRGTTLIKILRRVPYGDVSFGSTYQEQAKSFRRYYREQYALVNSRYGRMSNLYFRNALIKNYIYKGPMLEWYIRVKARIDGYYDFWDKVLPRGGVITDVGCGYGQLCVALGILSPDRQMYGFDYDRDKIEIAANTFLASDRILFAWADMRECVLPQSDAFVFNDSLHYVDVQTQYSILRYCASRLNDGGTIVVRDADASQGERHMAVRKIEKFSTMILGFNKMEENLTFVDNGWMKAIADELGMDMKSYPCDGNTSETIYILTRK